MKNINLRTYFYTHNVLLFNLALWTGSFIILLFAFTESNIPQVIDYIYTTCFLITVIIPVSINLYLLIPNFLSKEKYFFFFLLFFTNLIFFTQINIWFFSKAIDSIFTDYYFISYHSNTKLLTIFSIFLITTSLLKLAEDWFYFNTKENKKLREEKLQINTKLENLKAQINPHFLFNSLNVIYSLAIEKKENTTDAIIQLSDILRYIIYDSESKTITLKDEVSVLKKYVAFQKFRHSEEAFIEIKTKINNQELILYPMLLLPLIENSFKHGIKSGVTNPYIKISITEDFTSFNFIVENNFESPIKETPKSGVGLQLIRKNLEIVYPKRHTFIQHKTDNTFKISLTIIPKV